MPSKSKAQKRLMQAAAHDPSFAKKVGVDPRVARELNAADQKVKEAQGTVKKARQNHLVRRIRGY